MEVVRETDRLNSWKARKSSTEQIYIESRDALVKASHVQAILKFVDAQPEPLPQKVRSNMSADTLAAVENSVRIKWLPGSVDVELTEAIRASLSHEQFRNFWMRYGLSTLGSPLLKQALEAALRLFGLSISRLITWTPRAYHAYYRNCGVLKVGEHSEHHCYLVHVDIPPVMAKSRPFIEGCAWCFAAIFPLTRTVGKVTVSDHDPDRGSATYLYEW